jgi:hypothetical protein
MTSVDMVTRSVLYSVIITTYNYAHYLKRAIDSVLAQEFESLEIIVVDDGSDDETGVVASQYGEQIRFVHQPHLGPFVAARTGFRLAAAATFIFVDADDRDGAPHHLHATTIATQMPPSCWAAPAPSTRAGPRWSPMPARLSRPIRPRTSPASAADG